MDKIDIEILKLLQENSRISITDISKEIELSRPSVKTRIDTMIKDGVIKSFGVDIDPKKLGKHMEFICNISNITKSVDEIVEKIESIDQIVALYITAGKISFVLKGIATSSEEMHEVIRELLDCGSVETSVVLDNPMKERIILDK